MAHTMQEALIEAGLVSGTTRSRRNQTIAPELNRAARMQELPKHLRARIQLGRISDLFDALRSGRVELVHASTHNRTEVVDITPKSDTLAHVFLAGEDEPRTFRYTAEVRFIVTKDRG